MQDFVTRINAPLDALPRSPRLALFSRQMSGIDLA
jgi:hypothetical protein